MCGPPRRLGAMFVVMAHAGNQADVVSSGVGQRLLTSGIVPRAGSLPAASVRGSGKAHHMARSTLGLMIAAFEASPRELVILAPEGTILAVNEAWRRFGRDNGAGSRCGVGVNYLHVTERAAAGGDEIAVTVLAALTAVFDGHTARATMDYACHSPLRQHWFRLQAERLPDRREVLLTHD